MHTRTGALCIAALLILSVFPCSHSYGASPEETVQSFLDAAFQGRHAEAYQYVSALDKKAKSLETYLEERSGEFNLVFRILSTQISYEIREVSVLDTYAKVPVFFHVPDLIRLLSDVAALALTATLLGEPLDLQIQQWLAEKSQGKDVPRKTVVRTLDLIREQDTWKILLNWNAGSQGRNSGAVLRGLLDEAGKLKEQVP